MNKPATPPEKVQRYELCPGNRYECEENGCSSMMIPEEFGDYVEYTDYAKLETELRAANQRADELTKLLKASEDWRTAYQKGKYELYAMGGDILEAAADHLPCNEGPLDRQASKAVGRPEIRAEVMRADRAEAELVEANQRADEAYNAGIEAAATYLIDKWGAVSLAKRVWELSKRPTPSPATGGTE